MKPSTRRAPLRSASCENAVPPGRYGASTARTPGDRSAASHGRGSDASRPRGVAFTITPYGSPEAGGTAFSREALRRGARLVDGFTLLLSQAAGQSALFTALPAEVTTLAARLPARIRSLFEVNP